MTVIDEAFKKIDSGMKTKNKRFVKLLWKQTTVFDKLCNFAANDNYPFDISSRALFLLSELTVNKNFFQSFAHDSLNTMLPRLNKILTPPFKMANDPLVQSTFFLLANIILYSDFSRPYVLTVEFLNQFVAIADFYLTKERNIYDSLLMMVYALVTITPQSECIVDLTLKYLPLLGQHFRDDTSTMLTLKCLRMLSCYNDGQLVCKTSNVTFVFETLKDVSLFGASDMNFVIIETVNNFLTKNPCIAEKYMAVYRNLVKNLPNLVVSSDTMLNSMANILQHYPYQVQLLDIILDQCLFKVVLDAMKSPHVLISQSAIQLVELAFQISKCEYQCFSKLFNLEITSAVCEALQISVKECRKQHTTVLVDLLISLFDVCSSNDQMFLSRYIEQMEETEGLDTLNNVSQIYQFLSLKVNKFVFMLKRSIEEIIKSVITDL
ncbi:hypothetical protein EIN_251740 [Entamoeba invadens IP1]|uniref:Uncharacterized protein n=1 Tax=Entamoeba invadens IP1 TaxID=370355 RepID=A0A0A1UEI5_ENTIV|nr:hypothetical protein EIN_251740 [Entamoeba invadens IP1]ELP94990.1 hypothetical protein EIN_251740 [Entamoeba invadens IP1]|eukprot:XP_004261761.1 hypothetical protein EIN_251740 [Entamoeba invadens IP1]